MLTAAGYDNIDHHAIDTGDHALHLFSAHLGHATVPRSPPPDAHERSSGLATFGKRTCRVCC